MVIVDLEREYEHLLKHAKALDARVHILQSENARLRALVEKFGGEQWLVEYKRQRAFYETHL